MKKAFIIIRPDPDSSIRLLKFWIKTHMLPGREPCRSSANWFFIHFTENEGMAFGMKLGGDWGKLILSLFRIIAVIVDRVLALPDHQESRENRLVVCISLILAGALGQYHRQRILRDDLQRQHFHAGVDPFFPKAEDMRNSCTGKWLTCSISRSSAERIPPGSHFAEGMNSSFSGLSSTLPTPRSPSAFSPW
ncbi:MAG: signal peptidase II [Marinilabiliales bacterium]|nr:signal peptidase II [Marinilabiliales bacterium]